MVRMKWSIRRNVVDELSRNEHHTNPSYLTLSCPTSPYATPLTYLTHVPTYIDWRSRCQVMEAFDFGICAVFSQLNL